MCKKLLEYNKRTKNILGCESKTGKLTMFCNVPTTFWYTVMTQNFGLRMYVRMYANT